MEPIKIPMFDRFDLISHIMPYYAHTHKAFLLLSSLCSVSRNKLDEYYEEFIYIMRDNWYSLKWDLGVWYLPSDLFRQNTFRIISSDEKIFKDFIDIYSKLSGFYFIKI